MSEPAQIIEIAHDELDRLGWSAGDVALTTAAGVAWMVFAHRGEHRIVVKAASQATAWQEAARLCHNQH